MAGGNSTVLRLRVLAVVVVALFSALFGRLWYLQIMAAPTLEAQAQANQLRTIVIPPLRGRILDREGRILATNVKQVVVTVDRRAVRSQKAREALFTKLAPVLGKTAADLERRYNSDRYDPLQPLPLAENVDESLAVYIKERQEDFPGVDVGEVASRVYTYGKVAAHVLGYVGKVSEKDVEQDVRCPLPDQDLCRYQLSDFVGKNGVEQMFESQLRGIPGYRKLEVDAKGRVVRVVEDVPPTPGNDVQLTIDVQLQAYAEDTLAQGLRYTRKRGPNDNPEAFFQAPAGAVVVTDTTNGQLLASASYPTYDPREFVAGMSKARLDQLDAEEYFYPLFDRVTKGEYSPGSTFKVVSGLAAVQSGLRGAYVPYEDTPRYVSPQSTDQRVFRSPSEVSLGMVDLARALAVSSDSYFYSIGNDLWAQLAGEQNRRALQDAAEAFGLGSSTGVQLPGEANGRIPSPEVKKALFEANPGAFLTGSYVIGDNINAAIGQGDVLVTPLQLGNVYSAIANGGKIFSLNVALRVYKAGTADTLEPIVLQDYAPRLLKEMTFPDGYRDQVMKGLRDVVVTQEGTAFRVFQGYTGMTVAGKTGTAQDFTKKSERDNSLFAAFGPFEDPKYTVVAVLERSGFGSEAAAPVVRHIFEGLSDPTVMPPVEPATFLDPAADFTQLPIEEGGSADPLPGSPPIERTGSRD